MAADKQSGIFNSLLIIGYAIASVLDMRLGWCMPEKNKDFLASIIFDGLNVFYLPGQRRMLRQSAGDRFVLRE